VCLWCKYVCMSVCIEYTIGIGFHFEDCPSPSVFSCLCMHLFCIYLCLYLCLYGCIKSAMAENPYTATLTLQTLTLQHIVMRLGGTIHVLLAEKISSPQHSATHCNTLQRTATHCNTLQHNATHMTAHCNTLQHTATHCNALQCTATHCDRM